MEMKVEGGFKPFKPGLLQGELAKPMLRDDGALVHGLLASLYAKMQAQDAKVSSSSRSRDNTLTPLAHSL